MRKAFIYWCRDMGFCRESIDLLVQRETLKGAWEACEQGRWLWRIAMELGFGRELLESTRVYLDALSLAPGQNAEMCQRAAEVVALYVRGSGGGGMSKTILDLTIDELQHALALQAMRLGFVPSHLTEGEKELQKVEAAYCGACAALLEALGEPVRAGAVGGIVRYRLSSAIDYLSSAYDLHSLMVYSKVDVMQLLNRMEKKLAVEIRKRVPFEEAEKRLHHLLEIEQPGLLAAEEK